MVASNGPKKAVKNEKNKKNKWPLEWCLQKRKIIKIYSLLIERVFEELK